MTGNLGDPKLGLADEVWEELSQSVDIVIHNGALVHWVYVAYLDGNFLLLTFSRYPYSKLKGPNVQGTLDALELCAAGRPKIFVFVSSTAVLDHDHYVQLSDRLCASGKAGVPESDDLEGSSTGLGKVNRYSENLSNGNRNWLWTSKMGQRISYEGSGPKGASRGNC